MTDLVDWYNAAEQEGKLSPVELAALFHYRYIRIHPFEDGNGRIARLMVNYILARHGWPMIVVRNRNKTDYLEALHRADGRVGGSPSEGATAPLGKIQSFLAFFNRTVCEEIQCCIDIVEDTDGKRWWYDGKKIKFRSESGNKILSMMRNRPYITYREMSEVTGISLSVLQKMIDGMRQKRYLERRDNDKCWYVLAFNSPKM